MRSHPLLIRGKFEFNQFYKAVGKDLKKMVVAFLNFKKKKKKHKLCIILQEAFCPKFAFLWFNCFREGYFNLIFLIGLYVKWK